MAQFDIRIDATGNIGPWIAPSSTKSAAADRTDCAATNGTAQQQSAEEPRASEMTFLAPRRAAAEPPSICVSRKPRPSDDITCPFSSARQPRSAAISESSMPRVCRMAW